MALASGKCTAQKGRHPAAEPVEILLQPVPRLLRVSGAPNCRNISVSASEAGTSESRQFPRLRRRYWIVIQCRGRMTRAGGQLHHRRPPPHQVEDARARSCAATAQARSRSPTSSADGSVSDFTDAARSAGAQAGSRAPRPTRYTSDRRCSWTSGVSSGVAGRESSLRAPFAAGVVRKCRQLALMRLSAARSASDREPPADRSRAGSRPADLDGLRARRLHQASSAATPCPPGTPL